MRKMSSDEYYYWLEIIESAKSKEELEKIREEILRAFDSDDDDVQKLVKVLKR